MLGTASQAPTRHRNHNGYLLRWDAHGFLFDPGEGTQRQMLLAGAPSSAVDRICLTHLHGDHSLGLPGVLQRLSLDRVAHPVALHFPASGAEYVERMRRVTPYHDTVDLHLAPIAADGVVATGTFGVLEARRLDHGVEAFGYRLVEPDGHRMLPDRLAAAGVRGPDVRVVAERGWVEVDGRRVERAEVSAPRRGQRLAFVMDTRLCDGVYALAQDADLLVIESTFLDAEAHLADEYGHLTARQAGRVAARCGVRRLVLTHFSQRYTDPAAFGAEAAAEFDGEIVVAADLDRIGVPRRG